MIDTLSIIGISHTGVDLYNSSFLASARVITGLILTVQIGAVLGADGCVYGIPANAHQVLKVDLTDPKHGKCTLLETPLEYTASFKGDWKWGHGVLSSNGKIYCTPSFCDRVLCIDSRVDRNGEPNLYLCKQSFDGEVCFLINHFVNPRQNISIRLAALWYLSWQVVGCCAVERRRT